MEESRESLANKRHHMIEKLTDSVADLVKILAMKYQEP